MNSTVPPDGRDPGINSSGEILLSESEFQALQESIVCLAKNEQSPAEIVAGHVSRNLNQKGSFRQLPADMRHPSVLAMSTDVRQWMVEQLGGPLEYWTLLLAAAKEWFPDRNTTRLGHTFCVRFEVEDATFWNDREEFEYLRLDYLQWKGIHINQ